MQITLSPSTSFRSGLACQYALHGQDDTLQPRHDVHSKKTQAMTDVNASTLDIAVIIEDESSAFSTQGSASRPPKPPGSPGTPSTLPPPSPLSDPSPSSSPIPGTPGEALGVGRNTNHGRAALSCLEAFEDLCSYFFSNFGILKVR